MGQNEAIFTGLEEQDCFSATPAAAGPWSAEACHGGAPAALLAGVLDTIGADGDLSLARFTVDILGPVPIGVRLQVRTDIMRNGRRQRLVGGELWALERRLARASALFTPSPQVGELDLEAGPDLSRRRPMPSAFAQAFTIVPQCGGFGETGPADVWFRLDRPMVGAQPASAAVRTVAAADFGSGIAHALAFSDWRFPTLDLTVAFARPPQGEWIFLQSRWMGVSAGRTTCVTRLGDKHGPFGQALQTVLIEPRAGPSANHALSA